MNVVSSSADAIACIVFTRIVPITLCAAFSAGRLGVPRLAMLAAVLGASGVAAHRSLGGLLLSSAWSLSYFGFAACLSHAVRSHVAARRIGRGALFAAGLFVYLVIPAAVAPPRLVVAALAIGWELALSSFSYSVESAKQSPSPGLSDALFFVLVNPVLVYPERGNASLDRGGVRRGALRMALGIVAVAANYAVLFALTSLVEKGSLSRDPRLFDASGVLRFTAYYGAQCAGLYFIHSGVASIQIGAMSVLGWRIPERYEYPFLACSPAEFWRRWNTYVGSWVRRYVFFPAVTRLRRSNPSRPVLATVLAVLTAFAAMGFLHDWVPYLGRRASHGFVPAMTAVFLAHGTVLLLFEAVARLLRSARAKWRFLPGWSDPAGLGLSWVVLRLVNLSLAWIAIPVLSRGELPVELSRLLTRGLG